MVVVLLLVLPTCARGLDRRDIAIVVNVADPLSIEIGEYYAARRGITFQNVIQVDLGAPRSTLTHEEFEVIRARVEEQVRPDVQAYALTWAAPYRVECKSITSAFAFGFDLSFCADGCRPTRRSLYFNSPTKLPYLTHKLLPTMSIAPLSFN